MNVSVMNRCVLFATTLIFARIGAAETVKVAVASNFSAPMEAIRQAYASHSDDRLQITYGSSGKIYAQILHGAPFQVFLSADAHKPEQLVSQGLAVKDSQFIYAVGRLALISLSDKAPRRALEQGNFDRLASANPRLAPYGAASASVVDKLGLNALLQGKRVTGENISQTFQFVLSGNAQLGFVAMSQVLSLPDDVNVYFWAVPADLHAPIAQHAVLLQAGGKSQAAIRFMEYLHSDAVNDILKRYGYGKASFAEHILTP